MIDFSTRRSFGKGIKLIESSNLVNLQKESYAEFLQMNMEPEKRLDQGLQNVLREILTIKDVNLKNHLEFISYSITPNDLNEEECVAKSRTYAATIKVKLRLIRYEGKGSDQIVKEIKEQELFLCEMPLMCANSGFIINGVYRTVVSQLHKSSGVFFSSEDFKGQGFRKIYSANIIPYRGAWIDFECDYKGLIWVKIDKRKKISFSTFFMLMGLEHSEEGFSKKEILDIFHDSIEYKKCDLGWFVPFSEKHLKSLRPGYDLLNPKNGEILVQSGKIITSKKIREIEELGGYCIADVSLIGLYLSESLKMEDAELPVGYEIDEAILPFLKTLKSINIYNFTSSAIRDTVFADKNNNLMEALLSFHKAIRPGEAATLENAKYLLKSMFSSDKYDLSIVGRVKINNRLKKYFEEDHVSESRVLCLKDFIAVTKCLLAIRDKLDTVDFIDHLASRRVRSVGELVANQCKIALYKIAKSLKERLNSADAEDELDLHAIVQSKVLISSLKEFFATSQLSQMQDNLNALSKLAHGRRITAMGKGGVLASRAGDGMRDVGESYYSKICPVETPEGQNIGLISYLSLYAKVNKYGFIQAPYKKVINGVIQEEVVYLDAQEEESYKIASYCINTDEKNKIIDQKVSCRYGTEYVKVSPEEVEYIDVTAGQILSVGASLIPFVENNDPGRALMGANMQRQALPLKFTEAPLVGTGIERQVGIDSMTCVIAHSKGKVIYVDSSKIFIQSLEDFKKIDTYFLKKFERSNAYSCINNKALVLVGDIVEPGQIIADGSSTSNGEIALGKNLRVAFLSYKGCTFEDSIVISERLLNDTLTSVKIEELVVSIKEGESVMRLVPGISDEFLKGLDDSGVICLGATVKAGDVLVGRVTPKAETILSPEQCLLKAMFGERMLNYADASLRVPPGCEGKVIDVKIFNKKEIDKNQRTLLIEKMEMHKLKKNKELEMNTILSNYHEQIYSLFLNETVAQDSEYLAKGIVITKEVFDQLSLENFSVVKIENEEKNLIIENLFNEIKAVKKEINDRFLKLTKKITVTTELPNDTIQQIKVFIAINRVIECGDKMAGRHGNKGVISKILPVHEMPFDADGNIVDIILNPLGVAARLNIGQIFEVNLGWVSKEIGKQVSNLLGALYNSHKNYEDLKNLLKKIYPKQADEFENFSNEKMIEIALKISNGLPFAVPSFDGAKIHEVKALLEEWNLPVTSKVLLRDGETGEFYKNPITVGYIYMMKLNHMVADKIHARSTGSYSLITQQPLGGKAKMGGQRKGEMEIWALQAYGAAYMTKESMTIKSDDHVGRIAAYEAITKGQEVLSETNTPEGFKVLCQELRAILINPECLVKKQDETGVHFVKASANSNFDALKATLMSPEMVRSLSFGEIKRAETLNYRTQKAEIGGLHCPVVFGPERDFQCACGRYTKMKYRGTICEKCHVEINVSRVRRERMGHIELACPVAHIWYAKVLPSSIGIMLDMPSKLLDKILRYEAYIVTSGGITPLETKQILTEEEFIAAKKEFGADSFKADMGAEAIETLLKDINLESEKRLILENLKKNPNELTRKKLIKKLKMINGFIENNTRPEWMIIRALPVLPADLRPLVALDGGRFATPDSNELYKKVIHRSNRLRLLQDFPQIVQRNEKRMIAAAVNAVIDNSRVDQPFVASNGRPLQSIGDILKGKQGRFRQNLLGKRVDFSGRSVIVVGPNLKLHQCGLPKKIALELFKPFIYAKLEQYGYAATLRSAKKIVEEQRKEVWEILKEVTYQHPIILNRAPTLHRLGIQAFEIILVDSSAIQLHPLVCSAFNADFDGDQMSVHLPLSVEAQIEARVLMMPPNNLLSPANGQPIVSPKKDMILGLYYLTNIIEGLGDTNITLNQYEVSKALDFGKIFLNQELNVIINCPVEGLKSFKTSPGRVILFNNLPEDHKIAFEKINKLISGNGSSELFELVYHTCKRSNVVLFADVLMRLGFEYATKSCASFGLGDLITLESKASIVAATEKAIVEYDRQYKEGLITSDEKRNKITDAWFKCDSELMKQMEALFFAKEPGKDLNPLLMMFHSGARGSKTHMKQLMTMRGFVMKPNGDLLQDALSKNYMEGFDSLSYFVATHGTRKGFTDMALKTADAGYFTRKLVDVAQDCIITSDCCDLVDGKDDKFITFEPDNKMGIFDYSGALGRVLAQDVLLPEDNSILLKKYHILSAKDLKLLSDNFILSIKIRSPITCTNEFGICATCYGLDLSKSRKVSLGEPVGVVAAQSIGEPGAQLTLRTFHTGGGSVDNAGDSTIKAVADGKIQLKNAKIIKKIDGSSIVLSRYAEFSIIDNLNRKRVTSRIPYGSKLFVSEGMEVKQGTLICEWDSLNICKFSTATGYVQYVDLVEGVALRKFIDESTGMISRIVTDFKKSNKKKSAVVPSLIFKDENNNQIMTDDGLPLIYKLEPDDVLMVEDGALVNIGDLVIRKPKLAVKSSGITAGLPRLIEIFEARLPKIQAVMSEIDGTISFGKDNRFKRCVIITSNDGKEQREYMISKEINILIQAGDPIKKGDLISEGTVSVHDILRILGVETLVLNLLKSIREIFSSQGMVVDNKHVECILRYMLRKVEIVDAKNSIFVKGEVVDIYDYLQSFNSYENSEEAPVARLILQGITRSASVDRSYLKAASFQEPHKALINACLSVHSIDYMRGMKEALIAGKLIPAGTGFVLNQWDQEMKVDQ